MAEMLAFSEVFTHKGGVAARQRPTPDQHFLGVVLMTKRLRPIRIEGNLAYVPLTHGYEAVIDAADAHLVDKYNWYAATGRKTVYGARADCSGPKQRMVRLHRQIMGEPDGLQVDHRDGDGLNNRRSNLRVATNSQNTCNQAIRRSNSSGYKGVHKHKDKWRADISRDGRRRFLGLHDTPEAAHAAYCKASAELHGEFGGVA